jgi:phosphatidylglycerophosphate synthase
VAARWNSGWLWVSVVFLFLNWLGDSLDGTLARVRKQQRPRYGFYVDHMADAVGSAAMMAGLCVSGYVHWPIAISMLIGFLLLSIESFLTTYVSGRFQLSQGVFGPTEIRILLAIGNVALIYHPYSLLFGHRFLLFDVGGLIAAMGMAVMLLVTSVLRIAELYRAEPLA